MYSLYTLQCSIYGTLLYIYRRGAVDIQCCVCLHLTALLCTSCWATTGLEKINDVSWWIYSFGVSGSVNIAHLQCRYLVVAAVEVVNYRYETCNVLCSNFVLGTI